MKIKRTILVLAAAVLSVCGFASANERPVTENESDRNEAKYIWTVPVTESGEGLPVEIARDHTFGPEDFYVMPDGTIWILNSADRSVSHYQGEKLLRKYYLTIERHPVSFFVHDNTAFVPGYDVLAKIDLLSGEQTVFPLPDWEDGPFGFLINDMMWENGKLLLITEIKGNYFLDEKTGGFTATLEGYSSERIGDRVIIKYQGSIWRLPSRNLAIEPINFNNDGSISVRVYDFGTGPDSPDWCTVRRYAADSSLLAASRIASMKWNHRANCFAHQAEDGSVNVLAVYSDEVRLYQVEVGAEDVYDNDAIAKEEPVFAPDTGAVKGVNDPKSVSMSRNTVANRALSMINYTWTYSNGHNRWSEYAATGPSYLQSSSIPSSKTGIPYCWGMYNAYATVTDDGGTQHKSFASVVNVVDSNNSSKRLYAAGNVDTSHSYGYAGTIGTDCSGFVSSAYGYNNKVNTTNLASNTTVLTTVAMSSLMKMDLLVKSGVHAMLYVQSVYSGGLKYMTYEENTTSERACVTYWAASSLSNNGYVARRPTTWNSCTHASTGYTYGYNTTTHWKVCNFCLTQYSSGTHVFIISESQKMCPTCGYTEE